MDRWAALTAALLLTVSLAPASQAAEAGEKIVILHTNDVHCALDDAIGYAGLAAYAGALEEQYGADRVTLVDAGDAIQGQAVGTLSQGEYIISLMNAAGYDLAVPGNHEFDDQRVCSDKEFALDDSKWTWKIYMQMFRPLYPEQEYGVGGKRWYSVDYGDLHLCSLSISRWNAWDGFEYPGWITKDDISPDSPQVQWLVDDLKDCDARFKWVTQHWHMVNRGDDGYYPVSVAVEDPENPGKAIYPDGDYCWDVLRPIYEAYGVDAVNFGHSHVYERYLINGVNYIEAASIGNNYRNTADPMHFSGNEPIIEENNFRSFMRVTVDERGMIGEGIQASVEVSDVETEVGYCGRVFETFTIAE